MKSQEQEQLKCPRCNSTNTKFCYYNNYNLSQPRHFCKSCRRYWTKGGALRNIPVGGGTRKNSKRPKSNNTSVAGEETINPAKRPATSNTMSGSGFNGYGEMLDVSGSFSSLLASNGHFGRVLVGENSHQQVGGSHDATEQLMLGLKGEGSSEWPNLSIFTPHSRLP